MQQYKKLSRGPMLDMDECVKQSGGNRFELVLIAAVRAREIARRHKHEEKSTQVNAPVTSLLEIQEGRIDGKEYLKKVK